jgi:hypothetical protein
MPAPKQAISLWDRVRNILDNGLDKNHFGTLTVKKNCATLIRVKNPVFLNGSPITIWESREGGVLPMSGKFRFAVLVAAVAFVAACNPIRAQDKKVTLTDKAGKDWIAKEIKVGATVMSGRDYIFSALPKEIVGATYVLRPAGDETKAWLANQAVKAKKAGVVYALMQTKYLGKDTFGEVDQAKLEKDGWKEVEGKVASTFPAGESWGWKAFKKDVEEGEVILQLDTFKWDNRALIVFAFK